MNKYEYVKIIIEETLSERNVISSEEILEILSKNIVDGLDYFNMPHVEYAKSKQKDDKDTTIEVLNDFINTLGNKFGFTDWDAKRQTIGTYENVMGRQCSNTSFIGTR